MTRHFKRVLSERSELSKFQNNILENDEGIFCNDCLKQFNYLNSRTTDKRDVRIRLGEFNLHHRDPSEQTFNATELFIHPLYTKSSHDFDIALIKLNRPADTSTDYVKSICLPLASEPPFHNDFCYVAGWGNTGNTISFNEFFLSEKYIGLLSNILQQCYLNVKI